MVSTWVLIPLANHNPATQSLKPYFIFIFYDKKHSNPPPPYLWQEHFKSSAWGTHSF